MSDASFSLTTQQAIALAIVESTQDALAAAMRRLQHEYVNQPEAAKLIEQACSSLDVGKMKWLQSTQRAIQVASVIPDKLKLVTG
jgi:hypothetical protein